MRSQSCRLYTAFSDGWELRIVVNAFVYMIFGRIVYFIQPNHRIARIKATLITHIFVWLDIATFIVQLVGGLMTSGQPPADQLRTGLNVYMAGIGLQEFFILVLVWLAITFWLRTRRLESRGMIVGVGKEKWKRMMITIYVVLGLITVGDPVNINPKPPLIRPCIIDPHHLPPRRVLRRHYSFQPHPIPRSLLLRPRRPAHEYRHHPPEHHTPRTCPHRSRLGIPVIELCAEEGEEEGEEGGQEAGEVEEEDGKVRVCGFEERCRE